MYEVVSEASSEVRHRNPVVLSDLSRLEHSRPMNESKSQLILEKASK